MICAPDTDLINRLEIAGISRRELAEKLGRPYGTVSCWLRGFNRMPDNIRLRIEKIIQDREVIK